MVISNSKPSKASVKANELLNAQADSLFDIISKTETNWIKVWNSVGYHQQNWQGNPYKNINQLHLFITAYKKGFEDPRWFTFHQINEQNLKLKKGSKASKISFVSYTVREKVTDDFGNYVLDSNGQPAYRHQLLTKPIVKIYNVFNGSEIEGLKPFKGKELSSGFENKFENNHEQYARAQKMIDNFCKEANVKFQEISSPGAFFAKYLSREKTRSEGVIVMPLKSQFESPDHFYSVAFHEAAHATSVLKKRDTSNYAKEELVAELTSMFLCKQFGFDGTDKQLNVDNSLSYLRSWIHHGQLKKEDFRQALKDAQVSTKLLTRYDLSEQLNQKVENKVSIHAPARGATWYPA